MQVGSWVQGGTYIKIENGDDHIFKYLTENEFVLIHVSVIRMCSKIKIKASLSKRYLLWLVLWKKLAAKTIDKYVFGH